MTTRAVLYLRQSRDVENTRAAVDRQLDDCERLCQRNGWDVVRIHTDNDTSATSRKPRPAYQALFADVQAGACDVIVAWAQDRLLRDVREGEDLIDLVERAGVRVVTVQGGDHDLSTPDGRMHVRLMAAISKGETEKKGTRQRRQQRQAAEQGLPPSRGLFGYRRDRDTGRLELHPEEAAVVREAFDRLFSGQSIRSITRWMADSGTTSVRGHRWSNRMVWSTLVNPRYAAVRCYYGQRMAAGQWPAIITELELEKAQAILSDPTRKSNHVGPARKWLGGGLYVCGRCGAHMRIGYRRPGERIYLCGSTKHLTRTAEPVDQLVLATVEARLARPDAADLLAGGDAELTGLRAEAEALRAKIARAQRDYDDELIDAADLRAVKQRRHGELTVVQRKITTAARTSRLATLATGPDPAAAFRAADLAMQREVIDALAEVVLLRGSPGRRPFDPSTVELRWRV